MKVAENITVVNQAKSRIKKAQKAGQTPSEADEDIVDNAVMKAYATPQSKETLDLNAFAEHISSHGCVYSKGDILAVLTMATDCIREQILDGKKVCLGDLGTFWLRISQSPADTLAEFNANANIKRVVGCWSTSAKLKNLKKDSSWNLVSTKKTATAVIKAQKHGVGTVTI